MPSTRPLRVIIGPTAAGKSALALALARVRKLAVISADSRQIYETFDIGTAKPTRDEQASVVHHGVGFVAPTHRYSAQQWVDDANRWMDDESAAGTSSVIVGGTGFYVRALVQPLATSPQLPADKRAQLTRWMDDRSLSDLRHWCERLDPKRAHLGRTQLYRAIETALLAGVRLGDVIERDTIGHDAGASRSIDTRRFQGDAPLHRAVHYLVVDPGPVLAERIAARVQSMLDSGWVDEVAQLMKHVPDDAPAWLASGYNVMRAHVRGEISSASAREQVVIETRQFAKRQRTWCRHQLREGPVTRISPDEPYAAERVLEWWDATEKTA